MLTLREELKSLFWGSLLWIPLGSLCIPVFCIFYIISRCVHFLAKLFHPDLIPISKSDAFTSIAPSNSSAARVYTCQIWRVSGLIDVDVFRSHFQTCFLSSEHNRQKYVNLYCHFVEYFGYIFKQKVDDIDLEWHIHKHTLLRGESVEAFIGKWMVAHDKSVKKRPTWMIKLIHDETLKETTLIFKLHHGLCDGYTIVHLVEKLSGQRAPYMFKEPIPPLIKRVKSYVQFPYNFANIWMKSYKMRKEKKILVNSGSKKESWMISLFSMNLDTVKGIRRVTNTNFVSVLMSVQIGALRRLFKENHANSETLINTPWETLIGHSMGWPKHPVPTGGGGMANHLTLTLIPANFCIDDPLERLLHVDRNFRESKSRGLPVVAFDIIFNILKHSPGWFSRQLVKSDLSFLFLETGMSTLLGSPEKHFILGHAVQNLWLPVVVPSLFHAMKIMSVPTSHSGILDVSVNAEASLVKDQELLDRLTKVHFMQELEDLRIRCQNIIE